MDLLQLVHAALIAMAVLLAVPIAVLMLECLTALLRGPKTCASAAHVAQPVARTEQAVLSPHDSEESAHLLTEPAGKHDEAQDFQAQSQAQTAVLIPAHNEASGIQVTLGSLLPQVSNPRQIIVIADNCTDDTAAIARSYGVTVLERHDPQHRGKGYALDYGVAFLRTSRTSGITSITADCAESLAQSADEGASPNSVSIKPDVIFTVDADCRAHPKTLEVATRLSRQTGQPVQVTNTLHASESTASSISQLRNRLSSFAFRVHTFVRPNGLAQLGFPSTLHGTGMTFPWPVLEKAPLASDNNVEDMQLSLELILAGYSPQFCAAGEVSSFLPERTAAAAQQRTRWEHGHLNTLLTQVPRLVRAAWQERRMDLVAIALHLSVPPLSLLVMLWLLFTGLAIGLGGLTGAWAAALLFGFEGGGLCLAILGAWSRFGRDLLPLQALLMVPFYIFWKVPIYLAFVLQPQREWARTDSE